MKQIFLVHDHQEDPNVRRHYLESVGFAVTLLSGSEPLMKLLRKQRPDAVVMDILIEGMNGFEACREIRKIKVDSTSRGSVRSGHAAAERGRSRAPFFVL